MRRRRATRKFFFFRSATSRRRNGPDRSSDRMIRKRAKLRDSTGSNLWAVCAPNWSRLLTREQSGIYTDLPAYEQTSNSEAALDWLRRANTFPPYVSFHDVRPLLASLRTFKDAGEIELIRKATNASIAAHWAAMRAVKPGASEREIAALVQYEWGKRGCERPAYAPIVGSGFNSTVLHYSDDSATMQAGDVVVMDVAGEYSMYASDITRTVPVSGHFTARQREIYDIVLGAQQAAIAAFQSGKSTLTRSGPNSLYKAAYEYINSHGKDLHGQSLGTLLHSRIEPLCGSQCAR